MLGLFIVFHIIYVMHCASWYHLYNFKNVKSTHGGVLILVKLQASACNFTKINFLPWVFVTFFKLYKWYQIAFFIYIKCHRALLIYSFKSFNHFFLSRKARAVCYCNNTVFEKKKKKK